MYMHVCLTCCDIPIVHSRASILHEGRKKGRENGRTNYTKEGLYEGRKDLVFLH